MNQYNQSIKLVCNEIDTHIKQELPKKQKDQIYKYSEPALKIPASRYQKNHNIDPFSQASSPPGGWFLSNLKVQMEQY